MSAPSDFLARYRAGEHEQVWRELEALREQVRDGALRDEARAVALETMQRVRRNLERIATVLSDEGYSLLAREHAVGAPSDVDALVAEMEAIAGGAIPLSVAAFYATVGSVDLREGDDEYDEDCPFECLGQDDPLQIFDAKEALEELRRRAGQGALTLPLAYGRDAKADPESGDDSPVVVPVPWPHADGIVRAPDRQDEAFVAYLRRAIALGGFPALDAAQCAPDWTGLALLTAELEPF